MKLWPTEVGVMVGWETEALMCICNMHFSLTRLRLRILLKQPGFRFWWRIEGRGMRDEGRVDKSSLGYLSADITFCADNALRWIIWWPLMFLTPIFWILKGQTMSSSCLTPPQKHTHISRRTHAHTRPLALVYVFYAWAMRWAAASVLITIL